ncbi:MAG TPA: Nif3-like dinuclear metal center hexameric protein [Saprospiraceae bacterium]|nr:Nif3-like dinuclear metal center hexameric protein [Saprospiraceae bacterium]
MTKINDLLEFMESIAPFDLQEDYDNSGLIAGNPEMEVKGVLVALDATPEVLDEALILGCNAVVSHHPILFTGIKRITGKTYVERSLVKAIQNNIALIAVHTNLDHVLENGVNSKIAEKIGVLDIVPLVSKATHHSDYYSGSGAYGYLSSPMKLMDFLQHVKVTMDCQCLRFTQPLKEKVQKIALCGGSGSFLLQNAIDKGAEVFISSDFKYHQFFDANDQIVIADIGHYESEQFTIELLFDLIQKNFSNFAAHYTKVNTNPINYL